MNIPAHFFISTATIRLPVRPPSVCLRRCAGCVAAAANGIGVVGVAPSARLVAVQAGDALGYFYPAATVCAFMHAAEAGLHVNSNSCAPPLSKLSISHPCHVHFLVSSA